MYDKIHSEGVVNGFYLRFIHSEWLRDIEVNYEIIPVEANRVHAEVHTSHSYDIIEIFLTRKGMDSHPFLNHMRACIKNSFYETHIAAEEAGVRTLERDRKKVENTLAEMKIVD